MDIKQAIDRLERELTDLRCNLKSLPDEPLAPTVAEYYRGQIRHVDDLFNEFSKPEDRTSIEAFASALDESLFPADKERLCIFLRRFHEAQENFLSKPVLAEDEPEPEREQAETPSEPETEPESSPEEAVFADYYASMIAELEASKVEAADNALAEKKAKAAKRAQERRIREARQRTARDEVLRAEAQRRGIQLRDEQSISAADLQAEEARRMQREQEQQRHDAARREQERRILEQYNARVQRSNRLTDYSAVQRDSRPTAPTEGRQTNTTAQTLYNENGQSIVPPMAQPLTAGSTETSAPASYENERMRQGNRVTDKSWRTDFTQQPAAPSQPFDSYSAAPYAAASNLTARQEQERRVREKQAQQNSFYNQNGALHSPAFYQTYQQYYNYLTAAVPQGTGLNSRAAPSSISSGSVSGSASTTSASSQPSPNNSGTHYSRESVINPVVGYVGSATAFVGSKAVGKVMGAANQYVMDGEGNPLPGLMSAAHYVSLGANAVRFVTTANPVKHMASGVAQAEAYQVRHTGYKLSAQAAADKELLQQLKEANGGKLPTSRSSLQKASAIALDADRAKISARHGRIALLSDTNLQTEIVRLSAKNAALGKELRHLYARGANRTTAEIARLAEVQKELKELKPQLKAYQALKADRDLLHGKEKRLAHMEKTIQKKMSLLHLAKGYPRHKLASLLREGADSNTEGLAVALDPHVEKLAVGTVKVPFKVAHAVAQNVAPVFVAKADALVGKVVTAPAVLAKKGVHAVAKGVLHLIPSGVKHAVTATQASVRSTIYGVKLWAANTKLGRGVSAVRKSWQTVTKPFRAIHDFFSAAFRTAKAVLIKVGAAVIAFILICCIFSGVLISSASSSYTVILSPNTGNNGKIDLSDYCNILRSKEMNWEAAAEAAKEKAEAENEAKEKSLQGKITLTLTDKALKNRLAILSMMAVRLQQDLDVDTNSEVQEYLEYLFDISHTQSFTLILDGEPYTCETEDCDTKTETYTIKSGYDDDGNLALYNSPITGTREVSYCPGKHQDYEIIATTTSDLEELFSLDHWNESDNDWDGWTEENKEWARNIYNQDWDELYTGFTFSPSGMTAYAELPENTDKIWNYLMDLIGNEYGVAGLMGNLYAESNLNPQNMEEKFEAGGSSEYHDADGNTYTDETYTAAIDSGEYTLSQFMYDQNGIDLGIGYGIAQWSYCSRKQGLYNLAKSRGVSIADLDMQLDYLASELRGSSTLTVLQNATSVREASDYVLENFERAVVGESTYEDRAGYGNRFYNYEKYGIADSGELTRAQRAIVYVATHYQDYPTNPEPGMCWRWVSHVSVCATGIGGSGASAKAAKVLYAEKTYSYDFDNIPVGAAVFTGTGEFGHALIYIGNGLVMDCSDYAGGCVLENCGEYSPIHMRTLAHVLESYDDLSWGWVDDKDLTTDENADCVSNNVPID